MVNTCDAPHEFDAVQVRTIGARFEFLLEGARGTVVNLVDRETFATIWLLLHLSTPYGLIDAGAGIRDALRRAIDSFDRCHVDIADSPLLTRSEKVAALTPIDLWRERLNATAARIRTLDDAAMLLLLSVIETSWRDDWEQSSEARIETAYRRMCPPPAIPWDEEHDEDTNPDLALLASDDD